MACGGLLLCNTGCDDFLDTENLTQKTSDNYPKTLAEAKEVIAGVYNNVCAVNIDPSSSSFYVVAELASDDRLGGGGVNDRHMQATDLLLVSKANMYSSFWTTRYEGAQRATNAILTLPNCEGYESDDQKNQMIGEAYFLRAYYYYELASMFENIPLHVTLEAIPRPQASPDETWGQIIADLKYAIEIMPARKSSGDGHVDKYAAEALMARAFLFYTGFYGKTEATLPNGGTVTKQMVISWIDDCVDNSGYDLVSDYRNLWAYSNRLTRPHYDYIKDVSGSWPEDDGGVNPEVMFSIKHSKLASWQTTIAFSNQFCLFFGVRMTQPLENTFPFGQGWGAGYVAPNLWDDWKVDDPNDIRREASICDIFKEMPSYQAGSDESIIQETDYYAKKTAPVTAPKAGGGYYDAFEVEMYEYTPETWQLASLHDLVIIRFADVLLMQSELKEDAAGMNHVRERVGLLPVSYSLENLQKERRYELAFEGVRWNDIRRWQIAETALAKQQGVRIRNNDGGVETTANTPQGGGYAARYAATKGFFPIPEEQINLAAGLYKQNEGWGAAALYSGWQ